MDAAVKCASSVLVADIDGYGSVDTSVQVGITLVTNYRF